ncbi:mRNA-binding protein PUF3 [Aspergillus saccharolyticus JOP 1030-1]|uniref:Pumilio homology domain family member 3 n=1 Tax=Aspergillus saccharolyticus JOP 1030-1 TaxID=1450539 RepID=A0A318ZNH9_9EURO|nr:translation repression protein [Aspergillus saccharolyticus JOP 1030-1]PYH48205.1 translation repression protein [Aspergillus saccharolyticus JOP 1030-1]
MTSNNSSTGHNGRSNRGSNINPANVGTNRPRASQRSMGNSFGSNNGSWNSNNIWGRSFEDQHTSDNAFEGKAGSSSLLSTSESDSWNSRPNPWGSINTPGSALTRGPNGGMASSPVQTRANDRSAASLSETAEPSSYFAIQKSGMSSSSVSAAHPPYMNGRSEGISPSSDGITLGGFTGFRSNDGRRQVNTATFGSSSGASGFPMKPGFSNLENTRAEEAPSSMTMPGLSQPLTDFIPQHMSRNSSYAHVSHNSASFVPHRPAHSSYSSFNSETQGFEGRSGSVDISAGLGKLQLSDGGIAAHPATRPAFMTHQSYDNAMQRLNYPGGNEDINYHIASGYGNEDVATDLSLAYQSARARVMEGHPISPTEYNRMESPFYAPENGPHFRNPSVSQLSDNAVFMRVREQHLPPQSAEPLQRVAFNAGYDVNVNGYPAGQRLNSLSGFYHPAAQLSAANLVQRGHREDLSSQVARSAVLEEFRANSKGNKRYELKDIYGHIVEFSGDQHGSRFIQQKLETANSDEKEQVFREICENTLQLMTDVFGNYVVQKLFEHGNQTQKKIIANQMKGHILGLSNQMYGCRVVQKALEHILTDQQASMVKELEHHVLRCVRDQNGNHVIQKAIERVPSEYVQFIINAFKGQVEKLSAHPYGCRVIQRMLEHCQEADRESILAELHPCTAKLISDQFGNYVIQHVIENGEEKDRSRMINVVISQLLTYSKHKFASNVVEKSIEFGEESQRRQIIDTLTSVNDRGESPLIGLMRDQYGNYVIQKILGQLQDSSEEKYALTLRIQPMLDQLKKYSYGKQIVAIEKLIAGTNPGPAGSLPHAATSTTPPNSHKSSPQPSKRAVNGLETGRAPVVGAAPPTPPPTDSQTGADSSAEYKNIPKTTVTSLAGSGPAQADTSASVEVPGTT